MINNDRLNETKSYFNKNYSKQYKNEFFQHSSLLNESPGTEVKSGTKEQIEIDTEVSKLSSRKLWQILQLNKILADELEASFIEEVQNELIARNDFNDGQAWNLPH